MLLNLREFQRMAAKCILRITQDGCRYELFETVGFALKVNRPA